MNDVELLNGKPVEPTNPLWGKVTTLALRNSPTQGLGLRDVPGLITAFAEIKLAAVRVNSALGLVDAERARAIERAAVEVIDGGWREHFPLRVVATGGGTSTNMNVNEVLAARAQQLIGSRGVRVHPNDHVNRSQSSNDTYPTAAHIHLARQALTVAPALRMLAASWTHDAHRYAGMQRLGRTSWQDAVLVPIKSFHEARAIAATRFADQFENVARSLLHVPLGGTVLGTGVGAPVAFRDRVVPELAEITGLEVVASQHSVDAYAHADGYAALADTAARCAAVLYKQTHELRILSSGPHGGLSELSLPSLQPGSSIMPGKVNPVVPSMVGQATFSIRAAALAVSLALSSGDPDFNSNSASVVASLSPALAELEGAVSVLATKCVAGLEWNRDRLASLTAQPFDELIVLAEDEGYDEVARAASARDGD